MTGGPLQGFEAVEAWSRGVDVGRTDLDLGVGVNRDGAEARLRMAHGVAAGFDVFGEAYVRKSFFNPWEVGAEAGLEWRW